MQDTTTLPKLLTAEQVAESLDVPKSRIYDLTRTGELPAVRFGRRYRYDPRALEAWMAEGGSGNGDG